MMNYLLIFLINKIKIGFFINKLNNNIFNFLKIFNLFWKQFIIIKKFST